MRRPRVASLWVGILVWGCVLGTGPASWGAEPARIIVASGLVAEPLTRLVAGRANILPFRAKHEDSPTEETLNSRWCAARASGAKAFVFDNSSPDPLDAMWRERLANQGSRTFTVGFSSRGDSSASTAPLLRQLHAMLVELIPEERAHWDASYERELRQLESPRVRKATVELAIDRPTARPASRPTRQLLAP
ncbi:MAG: hypothetical protein U1A77_02900 [Pirellulales bacterium]